MLQASNEWSSGHAEAASDTEAWLLPDAFSHAVADWLTPACHLSTQRSGYPLVDAVMRCLAATGFINFRMRAMVVNFACHVQFLDWRLIRPHLAQVFRDYDPGIH